MSPSEYQELVAFLGQRFEAIDRRFEAVDRQFGELRQDVAGFRADVLRHFDELYRRLERLEQEYQAITHALRRIEAVLADERGRREILERDLATLRDNVAALTARIDEVERRLRS
jgi:chromosome segregation ATPase